jgi:hypothetical protein
MTDEEHIASLKEWAPGAEIEIVDGPSDGRRWAGFLYVGKPYRFGAASKDQEVADSLLRDMAELKLMELGAL